MFNLLARSRSMFRHPAPARMARRSPGLTVESLEVRAVPAADFAEPNDTRETATPLALNTTVSDLSIEPTNDVDYFTFTLTETPTSRDALILTGAPGAGDLDIEVWNSANFVVRFGFTVSASEVIPLSGLVAGTYTARVFGSFGATGGYSIRIDLPPPPAPDAAEPNNSLATATPLVAGNTITGLNINSVSDQDYFRFDLTATGVTTDFVGINVTSPLRYGYSDLYIDVLNSNGDIIRSSGSYYGAQKSVNLAGLPAGTYFMRVGGRRGAIEDYSALFNVDTKYVVLNTNDSGVGSLRDAINTFNNDYSSSRTGRIPRIEFAIPGAGPHTIRPQTPLPPIGNAMFIDGTTQPGYAGSPLIALDGTNAGASADGLIVSRYSSGPGIVIAGLSIGKFSHYGINVGAPLTTVVGCYLGLDPSGAAAGNGYGGVQVFASSSTSTAANVIIGGANKASDANVISGNGFHGVVVYGNNIDVVVQNNLIGTNPAGTAAVPNTVSGVHLEQTAGNRIIGNVVSGNAWGIEAFNASTTNNTVAGNRIGTNAAGTAAVPNGIGGVFFALGAQGNTVGGASPNVISGNQHGVVVWGASGNTIAGNYIGTDATGLSALPNTGAGVILQTAATDNSVTGNILAGNGADGVWILGDGTARNSLTDNHIGLGATGLALPNANNGVYVGGGASDNQIGGLTISRANYISGNGTRGVALQSATTTNNAVQNNYIGVGPNGMPRPNTGPGVFVVDGASANRIMGNVITRNTGTGVLLTSGTGNTLRGNNIYDNGLLGIDLSTTGTGDGVTSNDTGDTDTGPNGLQNTPTISGASLDAGTLTINGTISTTPDTQVVIEFFASTVADSSGSGEGESFLGSVTVTTNPAGTAPFTALVPYAGSPAFTSLSATATVVGTGDTSEFSEAFPFPPRVI